MFITHFRKHHTQMHTHHVLTQHAEWETIFVQSSGKIRKTFYKEFYMNLWFRFYYYTIYGCKKKILKNDAFKSKWNF